MIRKYGLYAVWVIAMFATLGSLYLNEVQYLPPCHLCWYQKICMYPLSIIVGLAAWKGFQEIVSYLLPQMWIGIILALFQVFIQSFSVRSFLPIQICSPGPDCKETIAIGIESFTLPILSAIAFFIIIVLMYLIRHTAKKQGA